MLVMRENFIFYTLIITFLAILSITNEHRPALSATRPKCNSILHLFGEWLFDAAHIGTDMWLQSLKSKFLFFIFLKI